MKIRNFVFIALLILVTLNVEISAQVIPYTVTKSSENLLDIVKNVCGSSRFLLQNAANNKIISPYTVYENTVLLIECCQCGLPSTQTPTTTIRTTTKEQCNVYNDSCNLNDNNCEFPEIKYQSFPKTKLESKTNLKTKCQCENAYSNSSNCGGGFNRTSAARDFKMLFKIRKR